MARTTHWLALFLALAAAACQSAPSRAPSSPPAPAPKISEVNNKAVALLRRSFVERAEGQSAQAARTLLAAGTAARGPLARTVVSSHYERCLSAPGEAWARGMDDLIT